MLSGTEIQNTKQGSILKIGIKKNRRAQRKCNLGACKPGVIEPERCIKQKSKEAKVRSSQHKD